MSFACAADVDGDELPTLPELDVDDGEVEGDDLGGYDLMLPEPDGDADDDTAKIDLPLELGLASTAQEPSALGDDATGVEEAPTALGLALDDLDESLLGSDAELGCATDDTLGIHELPEGDDRTDAEGLDDPAGEQVDTHLLPVLESEEDGDGEIDVGIDISTPPAEPSDEGSAGDEPSSASWR